LQKLILLSKSHQSLSNGYIAKTNTQHDSSTAKLAFKLKKYV